MEIQPEISFRNVEPSPEIEQRILDEIDKLERYYDRITGCRVMVEVPHRQHEEGNLYHVRIDLTVPGAELVVSRDPPEDRPREELQVAIRDSFDDMARQLEDHVRRIRGRTKDRPTPKSGRILRLFPDEGYGFIETLEGEEIYFHEHAVLDPGFEALEVGDRVMFAQEQGNKGPQAPTVRWAGRPTVDEG